MTLQRAGPAHSAGPADEGDGHVRPWTTPFPTHVVPALERFFQAQAIAAEVAASPDVAPVVAELVRLSPGSHGG